MNETYAYVYKKGHPRENKDHFVYEHILVAESILGRYLQDDECVHHIDHNRKNNNPVNLMVFATNSDHIAFHHGARVECENGVFKAVYEEAICPSCGVHFTKNKSKQKYCSLRCSQIAQRKVTMRPSTEVIHVLLKENTYVEVGRMFGVSDNTIRKWLKTNMESQPDKRTGTALKAD